MELPFACFSNRILSILSFLDLSVQQMNRTNTDVDQFNNFYERNCVGDNESILSNTIYPELSESDINIYLGFYLSKQNSVIGAMNITLPKNNVNSNCIDILSFAVDKSFQSKGIGSLMLAMLYEMANFLFTKNLVTQIEFDGNFDAHEFYIRGEEVEYIQKDDSYNIHLPVSEKHIEARMDRIIKLHPGIETDEFLGIKSLQKSSRF